MASITLKDIPVDLRARLEVEASANFRSLAQEALARLQRSLDFDADLTAKRDQSWIDEALASGPEKPFSRAEFQKALKRCLSQASKTRKAV